MNLRPTRARRIRPLPLLVTATVCLLGPAVSEAHAYIDPGTGSSLLPVIGMMLAVVSACIATMWMHIKRFFVWAALKLTGRAAPEAKRPTEAKPQPE